MKKLVRQGSKYGEEILYAFSVGRYDDWRVVAYLRIPDGFEQKLKLIQSEMENASTELEEIYSIGNFEEHSREMDRFRNKYGDADEYFSRLLGESGIPYVEVNPRYMHLGDFW